MAMDRIRAILGGFLDSSSKETSSEETFFAYTVTAQGHILDPVDRVAIESALKAFAGTQWTMSVLLEGQDSPHSLASLDPVILDTFFSELAYGAALVSAANLKLHLLKPLEAAQVVVFDPNAMFEWINALPLPDALARFDELVGDRRTLTFRSPSFTETVSTKFFRFSATNAGPADECIDSNRPELLTARREQTVSDWNTLNLLPDDFRWTQKSTVPALEKRFAALENFLGVVSLADSTVANSSGFALKVKGSVVQEEDVPWPKVPIEPDIPLRSLFEWCYRASGAGPLPDKLGLVRNFISLYWEFGVYALDLRVVAAVRSGYSLYLKKNLKDFVELRAKVAAFIIEIDSKAAKSVETATSNLEKNFYGLTTFITSVVLIKVLQDKTFLGAFTPQLTLLGVALIVISALHAYFARCSALKEMDRAISLYGDLRQLYSAFFTASDFDSLFRSDGKSPVQKTEEYVRDRLFSLMCVWAATLLIASGLLCALYKWS
jgi:hypothetical protein